MYNIHKMLKEASSEYDDFMEECYYHEMQFFIECGIEKVYTENAIIDFGRKIIEAIKNFFKKIWEFFTNLFKKNKDNQDKVKEADKKASDTKTTNQKAKQKATSSKNEKAKNELAVFNGTKPKNEEELVNKPIEIITYDINEKDLADIPTISKTVGVDNIIHGIETMDEKTVDEILETYRNQDLSIDKVRGQMLYQKQDAEPISVADLKNKIYQEAIIKKETRPVTIKDVEDAKSMLILSAKYRDSLQKEVVKLQAMEKKMTSALNRKVNSLKGLDEKLLQKYQKAAKLLADEFMLCIKVMIESTSISIEMLSKVDAQSNRIINIGSSLVKSIDKAL